LAFCVLTKGGERALADVDLYRPDRDAFASTLTSLDERFSSKWERSAAVPDDRVANDISCVIAHEHGSPDVKGRSVMIHAGGDNYSDQPAPLGGGGARIACGVAR
jgi:Copper/zinc superoxide dismutase (SODC)